MTSLPRWSEGEGPSDPGLRAALSDARRGPSEAELTTLAERVAQRMRTREGAAGRAEHAPWLPRAAAWLAGIVVVLSAAWWWSVQEDERTPRAPSIETRALRPASSTPSSPTVAPPPARERVVEGPAPVASESTHAPVRSSAPAQKRAQRARKDAAGDGDEVRLLQAARRALLAQPEEALALANLHAARFAQGLFVEEREAIAIEALFKLERAVHAERALARFLHDYPQSTYRARLLRLREGRTNSPR